MARTGQAARGTVASGTRLLELLDALAEAGEAGTNELARRSGSSASTVSRRLGTLVEAGWVEHVPASGRYRLGIHVVRLANAVLARLDVRQVARPHLEALVRETGETATLSVPGDGDDAITIDFVPSAHYVQHVTQLGRPSIGHATSAGKVMLAWTARRPPRRLQAFTSRTITDHAALASALAEVRAQGFAVAVEEREPGLAALAAPVFGAAGELAAIVALQGPVGRFGDEELRAAVPTLLERTGAISTALGWRAPAQPHA